MSQPLGSNANPTDGRGGGRGRIDDARLDALLDAFFDKQLSVDDSSDLFKGLRTSPKKAREFAATRRFVEDLRRPVDSPDMTRDILAKVHAGRPWLRDRDVWGVRLGRIGLVAMLLLVLGGVLLQRRATPDAPVWNAGPAPLTELVRSSGEATQRTRENARAALATLRVDGPLFGVVSQPIASVVAYKPAMPDVREYLTRFEISPKPSDLACAGFRASSSRSSDRDVLILRIGAEPGQHEVSSTLVTFRPR